MTFPSVYFPKFFHIKQKVYYNTRSGHTKKILSSMDFIALKIKRAGHFFSEVLKFFISLDSLFSKSIRVDFFFWKNGHKPC